ncbi:MAG: N-formylglutamate amidohydrolase [Oricola sp.]
MGASTRNAAILAPSEEPAAEVVNPDGKAPIVLVCEHASAYVPKRMAGLGLRREDRLSHAAWDIGALAVATRLSRALDAPLVASRISRLVYDCNRPPEAPDSIPAKSELIEAPANANLSAAERQARVHEIYEPFRDLVAATIAGRAPALPALVTIHSFTPVFFGVTRTVELGLLHDTDDRLACAMLAAAPAFTPLRTALNEPYGPQDGVTHTLKEHAIEKGLLNVMIEIRNDFVRDEAGVAAISDALAAIIERGLEACEHPSVATRNERRKG